MKKVVVVMIVALLSVVGAGVFYFDMVSGNSDLPKQEDEWMKEEPASLLDEYFREVAMGDADLEEALEYLDTENWDDALYEYYADGLEQEQGSVIVYDINEPMCDRNKKAPSCFVEIYIRGEGYSGTIAEYVVNKTEDGWKIDIPIYEELLKEYQ
ncbi:hypothetical protein [Evansella clarkii]|uniref:hypothetical protein n=1 Tax=Evansella clarkii TaxID=79879 RepID=UPI0009967FAC|nr:hypothetical protein [Evansella clarkii]